MECQVPGPTPNIKKKFQDTKSGAETEFTTNLVGHYEITKERLDDEISEIEGAMQQDANQVTYKNTENY